MTKGSRSRTIVARRSHVALLAAPKPSTGLLGMLCTNGEGERGTTRLLLEVEQPPVKRGAGVVLGFGASPLGSGS